MKSTVQLNPLGVVAPPPIEVECEAFSGSLAALYDIVRAHRLSLLDVPMRPICEAYLRYLLDLKEEDLDSAAAAMVALSYLIETKADAIIPQIEFEPEWEDAPEIDFAEPYIREFDKAIEVLTIFEEEREKIFFRGGEVGDLYELPFQIGAVTSADLSMAFERLLKKASPEPPEILQKSRRSLATQMEIVLNLLSAEFQSLSELVPQPFTRTEAVWWFLSLLELIKNRKAVVRLGNDDVLFARAPETPGAQVTDLHLTGTSGAGPQQPSGANAPPPHPSSLRSQTLSPSGEGISATPGAQVTDLHSTGLTEAGPASGQGVHE